MAEALRIFRATVGETSPLTAHAMSAYGRVRFAQGPAHNKEAKALLKGALKLEVAKDAFHLESVWEVLNRLTRGAPNRFVIFDSPPALAATPAAELAKHVGQALLVARSDQTGRAALEDAVDLLSACPDIKLLLNDTTFSPSGRRFGSYYGYGETSRDQ